MNTATAAEKKFLKRMSIVAEKEATKLGLKPTRFSGGYVNDSLIFELQFEPSLKNMRPVGNA